MLPPEAAPADRLAMALDVSSLAEADAWLARLAGQVRLYKVGLELYLKEGMAAVDAVSRHDARCFLDLKLHDIPATVASAVRQVVGPRVRYLTVHAAAGRRALQEAATAAEGSGTTLLAVTVLTSLDDRAVSEIGAASPVADLVLRRAELALESGISGLVCSPEECRSLRRRFGNAPTLVVPGIRLVKGEDDQARTRDPAGAVRDGADVLVVGRPIRSATDPAGVVTTILEAIADPG
ncbi:MAG: orotidine-5'-phosphate decarboxylase [Myxococcota bacterium]